MKKNFKKIKANLKKPNQVLIFDFQFNFIESCNTLFDTNLYKNNIIYQFPILESIFDYLKFDDIHLPIRYHTVNNPSPFLTGYFDIHIENSHNDLQVIIYSLPTQFIEQKQQKQQIRNEKEIKKQLIEVHFNKNN